MGNEENDLDVWIDSYLREEMTAKEFAILVILRRIKEKQISYISSTTELLNSYLVKKHLTPKEEQQITEILKRVFITENDTSLSDADKTQNIEDCEDAIKKILELVSSRNNT